MSLGFKKTAKSQFSEDFLCVGTIRWSSNEIPLFQDWYGGQEAHDGEEHYVDDVHRRIADLRWRGYAGHHRGRRTSRA